VKCSVEAYLSRGGGMATVRKWLQRGLLAIYLVLWFLVVLKATLVWGLEWGAGYSVAGFVFLIVFWRHWRIANYVLFGGTMPWVAMSQGTDFLPPTKNKKWSPPT
jgi:hypothetical protein